LELQSKFEWDEAKNRANVRKHGFDLADVREMFKSPVLTIPDLREDYGEDRWIAIGTVRGTIAVAVLTEREPETVRVISLRKATHNEQKQYAKAIQDQLETYRFDERQRH